MGAVLLKPGVCKIDNAKGEWIIKVLRAQGEWQVARMRESGILERAAFDAGVPMAAPVLLWVPVRDGFYARCSEYVPGAHPAVSEELAVWVGSTLAQIECLRLPATPGESYQVHPVDEWESWLAEAGLASLLPAVVDATAIIQTGLATQPEFQLAHRDVSLVNIVSSARGLMLIDFDHAGPEVPWWEFVHHVFNLDPSPGFVRPALESCLRSGGSGGAVDQTAFSGYLRGMLEWLAYNIWLTLGHRDLPPARRVEARAIVHTGAIALPQALRDLPAWTEVIAEVP